MNEKQVTRLIEKYLAGSCSAEEKAIVDAWYEAFDTKQIPPAVYDQLMQAVNAGAERSKTAIDLKIHQGAARKQKPATVRTILRMTAAAAIIAAVGLGIAYFYLQSSKKNNTQLVVKDIPAGEDKAMLTLADGSVITLDKAAGGTLATQGNVSVQKQGAVLSYLHTGTNAALTGYNTITTPRGGQFQVILPDGTNVWLNAASSLRFPVQFGATRGVTLTGEGYFEVAKDKVHPFHVSVNGQDVEVLGTHFNVNGYRDKHVISATLLEGAIRLSNAVAVQVLHPGQQANVTVEDKIVLNDHPDIEETMAWHNGLFYFSSLTIDEILQQVARWYDVKIVYQEQKPQGTFSGKISRNTNLSEVLKILAFNGIKYRLEERVLVIE